MLSINTSVDLSRNGTDIAQTLVRVWFFLPVRVHPENAKFKSKRSWTYQRQALFPVGIKNQNPFFFQLPVYYCIIKKHYFILGQL